MRTDRELLLDYVDGQSNEAFELLLKRHVNLVYSAALRQLQAQHLAEDVVQTTFIELSRQAKFLAADTVLPAWLYDTARKNSIDLIRRETRRQLREQIACELQSMDRNYDDWAQIEYLLDDGMASLDSCDRAAVLLRYFQGASFREVGAAINSTEDTAQKRVSRAVEKLRNYFGSKGVKVNLAAMVAAISANSIQAAPASVVPAILGTLKSSSAATVGTLAVSAKIGMGVALLVLGGLSLILIKPSFRTSELKNMAQSSVPVIQGKARLNAGVDEIAILQEATDPLELLKQVAQARKLITSGEMKLKIEAENIRGAKKWTNSSDISLRFSGEKVRFQTFKDEYAYATFSVKNEDEEQAKKDRERVEALPKEEAVKEGLLKKSAVLYVTASEGSFLTRYSKVDGRADGTIITEDGNGSAEYFF